MRKQIFCFVFIVCTLHSVSQVPVRPELLNINADGILSKGEWLKKRGVTYVDFNFGRCYYVFAGDSVYFAFDVYTDNTDDYKINNNPISDRLLLYFDSNKDGIIGDSDLVFESSGSQGILFYHNCVNCDETNKIKKVSAGKIVAGFGISYGFDGYQHRIWEVIIPRNELPLFPKMGFAFFTQSAFPLIQTASLATKEKKYTGLLIVHKEQSLLTEQIITAPAQTSIFVVNRKILDDGKVEITFSDSSKIIKSRGGIIKISPDGHKVILTFLSTPLLVPPALPSENSITAWLDQVNKSLLELIQFRLNNDAVSIANFQKPESSLKLYEIINRRIEFINYLNTEK